MPVSTLVSIVEDHPLFRAALATVIGGLRGVRPGPVAGSVEEFLAYRAPAGGVVLLDLHLPGVQGAAATLAICEAGHRPLIVSAQSGVVMEGRRMAAPPGFAAGLPGFSA